MSSKRGYWRAYRDFYTWRNIVHGAAANPDWTGRARHVAYSAGWKKFEGVWDALIRGRQVAHALPVLEGVLSGLGRIRSRRATDGDAGAVEALADDSHVGEAVRFRPRTVATEPARVPSSRR